jgi:MFS family permease
VVESIIERTLSTVRSGARSSKRAVFAKPGFAATYAVGMVWSLCRWAIGFLGAYVVADATDSARLVQLTGVLLWAPLLFAGVVGGAVSDRFSRRSLLFVQFGVLGPLTAGLGVLSLQGDLPLWVLYLYMVIAGFGWVVDMTARRTLVHDLVGDAHIDDAMALEGLASAFGLIAGTLAGGALIGAVGAGGAYLAVAGAIGVAALFLLAVPPTPRRILPDDESPSLVSEMRAGLRLVGQTPTLASVLGVTALVNFFHFAYFPIVPVIAQRVGASPFATGLMAAATGAGMAVGAMIVLRFNVRRGAAYVVGATGAFVFLIGFGAFDRYWLVFASLFVASSFVGMFASTQGALVMTSVEPAMRGRAMGLLSMAIGVLPLGMILLGEVSELVGAPTALIISNLIGLVCVLGFLRMRPQALHIR